jgi:DNA modification methylase
MTVRILVGDVREKLRGLPPDSVDCVVTSPPYWGLRSYLPDDHPDKPREIGLERTLGEHLDVLVGVFREVGRVMKPEAPLWLNYGDCYATAPNGRSAADTKAAGNDDRTFRDKPFSTVGTIYAADPRDADRRGNHGRGVAGGYLKPKDLCLVPFRLAIALQESGWWVRSRIMWGKPNGMPDSSGKYRPSVAHEEIFLLSKSGELFYDAEAVCAPAAASTGSRMAQNIEAQSGSDRANGGRKTNGTMKAVGNGETRYLRSYEPTVWHIATAAYGEAHFATFPPALVERCLMAGLPKDRRCLVLDPFGGAGTVGLVADGMGHDAILIDIYDKYAGLSKARIETPLFSRVTIEEAA